MVSNSCIIGICLYWLSFLVGDKKNQKNFWGISKIQVFVNVLGEKGAEIFFYAWGIGFAALDIWLLTLS